MGGRRKEKGGGGEKKVKGSEQDGIPAGQMSREKERKTNVCNCAVKERITESKRKRDDRC